VAVSTGTAWGTSLAVPITFANGGTGETTRQAAIDALAGAVTSGQYLRGNGTDVVMSAIQAADVPTLNQSTTGNAATATTATTATTANALNSANTYSVTRLTATPNTSGVSTGITAINGDMTAYRSGGTTGVIYLSSSGSHYLYWDGTNYNLNSGNLLVTGNISASSDERLKTNWRDLPVNFVEQLAKVKHGIYDRIDVESTQIGVGAQSLRDVMEHAVAEDSEGRLSVAYGNAALVACVKLAERIVELEKLLESKGLK
jgi:hypothetical protein